MTKPQKSKKSKKPIKSKASSPEKKRPLSERECSSDPNDWHPRRGPHPSD